MRQTFYILIISVLITSCATILNQPYKNVKVHTTEPSRIVHRNNTVETVNNSANIWAERKNENLSIIAITDSITKTIDIRPRLSSAFWANIYFNWGIGMLVDMNNPKRYTFPKNIYINSTDTINRFFRYSQSNNKGELHLHFSLPHFNFFRMAPEGETVGNNTSFWGLTVGIDYYHSKNQFVNLGFSYALGFVFPVPASVRFDGEVEFGSTKYISLSNNHKIGKITIGYGLSYGRNTWDYAYYTLADHFTGPSEFVTKSHNLLGFVFPAYFQLGKRFNLGLVYRPTFYRPSLTNKYAYEHLISIDFAWKIRLKK